MGSPSGHVFLLLGSLFFWTEAGHGYLSQFVQGERSRASQLSLQAGLDGTRSSGTFKGFGVMWTVRWAPRGIAAPRSVIRGGFFAMRIHSILLCAWRHVRPLLGKGPNGNSGLAFSGRLHAGLVEVQFGVSGNQ